MVRKASAKTSAPRVTTIPFTKARNNLGAVIQQVHLNKEYLILDKDRIPVAGIMDIDEFENYIEIQDPKVRALIAKGRQEYLTGKSRPVEDLLRQLQVRNGGKDYVASGPMTSPFAVRTIPQFDRLLRRLDRQPPTY